MRNHLCRAAATLVSGVLLSGLVGSAALAHAAYESSDPGNGATVSSPPSRITAEFTEPVVDDSRLEVYDPCGTRVDNGDSVVAADRITVSMSADKQGTYRVHFAVVSSIDGHPTSGDFGFTSSGGSPCPGEEPAEEEPSGTGGGGGNSGSGGGNESDAGSVRNSNGSQPNASAGPSNDRRSNAEERTNEGAARSPRGERAERTRVQGTRLDRAAQDVASGPTVISASEAASIWEGIPLLEFLAALLVAALIGGAGGLVYAGIMGPKV